MLKTISNLGSVLNKQEQKSVKGSGKGCKPLIPCGENQYYDKGLCRCVAVM